VVCGFDDPLCPDISATRPDTLGYDQAHGYEQCLMCFVGAVNGVENQGRIPAYIADLL
jgi:hypothetical protein